MGFRSDGASSIKVELACCAIVYGDDNFRAWSAILSPGQYTLADAEKFGFNGDIGHYDEAGNIYFDYRQSDLLKVDNYWFGPGEIESVLEGSDEIEEAMVWGEYDPGSGNDLVHVALVFTTTQGWPEQRVRDLVAERLPKTRHITGRIHVLKELPHSRQGKKLRRELKDQLTSIGKM